MSFERDGVWPVPHDERLGNAVVSDGYGCNKRGGKGHLGVDIMYRRPSKGSFNRPVETPWFRMPNGMPAIACYGGRIWSVRDDGHGFVVKIDHGKPWLSVVRHLKRPMVGVGDYVSAGQIIGDIGADPNAGDRGINHVHFEIWDTSIVGANSRCNRAIDPAPFLRAWSQVSVDGRSLVG